MKNKIFVNETFDTDGYPVPPWIKFPTIVKGSMGWRMGGGEHYLEEYSILFCRRKRKEQVEIMKKYPEPDEWKGYYKSTKLK